MIVLCVNLFVSGLCIGLIFGPRGEFHPVWSRVWIALAILNAVAAAFRLGTMQ